jgi:hypothetical protein
MKRGFWPDYAFDLGLLDPNIPDSTRAGYLSKKELLRFQQSLNPKSWEPLLEDKSLFYRYCRSADISIPKLYAIFFRDTAGWTFSGHVPASRGDWKRFLEEEIPREFVIKPARGAYGREIKIFTRSQQVFNEATGKSFTADNIYEMMSSNSPYHYDCYVIQERVKNHPGLMAFTNSKALQTIRMITLANGRNQFRLLIATHKFAISKNIIDNIERGLTGNIRAEVSDNGFLNPALTIIPNRPGVKKLEAHPNTGLPFREFQVPFWDEACRLVKEVHLQFLPIQIIGWDVAITPNGPVIIEGNIWCDPPTPHKVDKIIHAISEKSIPGF